MRSVDEIRSMFTIIDYPTNPGHTPKNEMKIQVLHSVGCSCQKATNFLDNQKNKSYPSVHGCIDGIQKRTIYIATPENARTYHAGSGANGNANSLGWGVEMCEPPCKYKPNSATFHLNGCEKEWTKCKSCSMNHNCSAQSSAHEFMKNTYETAVLYFAMRCVEHARNPKTCILSHHECHMKGIGSGHVDPEHMWDDTDSGLTMDGFRADVQRIIDGGTFADSTDPVDVKPTIDASTKVGDVTLEDIAKKLMGESGVASGRNPEMLLAVAQCIKDLSDHTGKGIAYTLENQFNGFSDTYTADCLQTAYDAFICGNNRFDDYSILDIRSFTNYGIDGGSEPDLEKCYSNVNKDHIYLGKDSCTDDSGRVWGHFYFGIQKEKKEEPKEETVKPQQKTNYIVYVDGVRKITFEVLDNLKNYIANTAPTSETIEIKVVKTDV